MQLTKEGLWEREGEREGGKRESGREGEREGGKKGGSESYLNCSNHLLRKVLDLHIQNK